MARMVAPVVGINAIATCIAHVLGYFEWTNLVCGVGLGVDGVRRTQNRGAHSKQAGKQALGEIHFPP